MIGQKTMIANFTKFTTLIFIASFASTQCMEDVDFGPLTITEQTGWTASKMFTRIDALCKMLTSPTFVEAEANVIAQKLFVRPGNFYKQKEGESNQELRNRVGTHQEQEIQCEALLKELGTFRLPTEPTPFMPRVRKWLKEAESAVDFISGENMAAFIARLLWTRKLTHNQIEQWVATHTTTNNFFFEDQLFRTPETLNPLLTETLAELKTIERTPVHLFATRYEKAGTFVLRFCVPPLLICLFAKSLKEGHRLRNEPGLFFPKLFLIYFPITCFAEKYFVIPHCIHILEKYTKSERFNDFAIYGSILISLALASKFSFFRTLMELAAAVLAIHIYTMQIDKQELWQGIVQLTNKYRTRTES
jgi:hypothetical protein